MVIKKLFEEDREFNQGTHRATCVSVTNDTKNSYCVHVRCQR